MRRIVFAFFATLILALVIMALSIGTAGAYAAAYDVPTSLCHDPLLGPTMIIYHPCGGETNRSVSVRENAPTQIVDIPTQVIDTPTHEPPTQETPTTEPPVVETPEPEKQKCNRGLGNGSEGCDPGNSGGKPGNAGEENE